MLIVALASCRAAQWSSESVVGWCVSHLIGNALHCLPRLWFIQMIARHVTMWLLCGNVAHAPHEPTNRARVRDAHMLPVVHRWLLRV
jgi:hypothetical protein